jgi:hypothetical protein
MSGCASEGKGSQKIMVAAPDPPRAGRVFPTLIFYMIFECGTVSHAL